MFWKGNPYVFTNHIDYSWDNFKERLRFQLPNSVNFISFDELMEEKNIEINAYPFIELILKYLKYSDEYRMRFTTLICGSYTYTGPIYIVIYNKNKDEIISSLFPHTCYQTIDVFIDLNEKNLYSDEFCKNGRENENHVQRVNNSPNKKCKFSIIKLDEKIQDLLEKYTQA